MSNMICQRGISTDRLTIEPLSYFELTEYVFGRKGSVFTDEDEDWTINNVLIPMSEADEEEHPYYTFWVAKRIDGKIVGDIGLKGTPSVHGTVEIGYYVFEQFRNKGYATEMVSGLLEWLKKDRDTVFVSAAVEPENTTSMKVLRNNGFRRIYAEKMITFMKQIKF